MTPLTNNPTVVLQVVDGKLIAVASNVAPDLKVVMVASDAAFSDEAANKPFNTVYAGDRVDYLG